MSALPKQALAGALADVYARLRFGSGSAGEFPSMKTEGKKYQLAREQT